MDNHTFRSRVLKLIQKSRKALRLYSNMGNIPTEGGSEFTDIQVREWKRVNAELVQNLTSAMDNPNMKQLAIDVFSLRERFQVEWRDAESELRHKQRDLISAAEHGDFIKGATLCSDLVVLKARMQACQAAHHELSDAVRQSRLSEPTIELTSDNVIDDDRDDVPEPRQAKVIPLRFSRK